MKFVSINNYFCDKKAFNIYKEVPMQIQGVLRDFHQSVDLNDWQELNIIKEKYGDKLEGLKLNIMYNLVDETNMARLLAEAPKMRVKLYPDQQIPFEFRYFQPIIRETVDIFDLDNFKIEIDHTSDLSQSLNPIISIHLQGVFLNVR